MKVTLVTLVAWLLIVGLALIVAPVPAKACCDHYRTLTQSCVNEYDNYDINCQQPIWAYDNRYVVYQGFGNVAIQTGLDECTGINGPDSYGGPCHLVNSVAHTVRCPATIQASHAGLASQLADIRARKDTSQSLFDQAWNDGMNEAKGMPPTREQNNVLRARCAGGPYLPIWLKV